MWENNKTEFEERLDNWLKALEQGEEIIGQEKEQFHQWNPLRVYVSVARAKSNSRVLFSLRFFGQEVAELFVKDKKVILRLNRRHSEKNKKYFESTLENGDYDWRGKRAKDFRAHFKNLASSKKGIPEVKMCEHRIESKFIQEMLKPSGKFGLSDLKIRPVTIGGCPLQFPVPISASTGRPEKSKGNIDILARHQDKDNKTRLSVWELKKPNAYNHAASQAYIYALTLLQVLRHENGSRWYKLFGYKSPIPKSIEIEAVVAITSNQKEKFNKEKTDLEKNTSFEIDGDSIKLYAAYYMEEAQSIKLERHPFKENQ
jgi:hypothetical protein